MQKCAKCTEHGKFVKGGVWFCKTHIIGAMAAVSIVAAKTLGIPWVKVK